ncbi:MAG: peptidoglycan DD-metalloendopeptidase family protein [Alkalibacterium sp.]|nr:peptidoglycan DD-metalloendopeptidase family protein [Alkalibacterium sp.]
MLKKENHSSTSRAIIAERTSTLNEEMKAEKQRIIEEERARQEALRIAEEKRQKEAEAKAKAEAAARAKAEAKASKSSQASTSSKPASTTSSQSNSGWTRPANGRYTSGFGYRTHPVTGKRGSFHNGTDIAGGGPIVASRAGTVKSASYSGTYGYRVIIDHGDGYETLYAHMQPNLSVAPGQRVSQGQQLGIMGTTGRSTGVHLHFIVYKNGTPVNPMNYIR